MTTRRNNRNTLQQSQAIVDSRTGLPTQLFIRYFNDNFANFESILNTLNPIALEVANIDDQLTQAVANSSTAIAIATAQSNTITELGNDVRALDAFVDVLNSKISTNTLDQESAVVQISALDEWLTLVEDDLRVAEANITTLEAGLNTTITRVDILVGRVDGHDTRLDNIDAQQTIQDTRLDGIDDELVNIEGEQNTQDSRLDIIEGQQTTQDTQLADHQTRITDLEDEPRLDIQLDGVSVVEPVYQLNFTGGVEVTSTEPNKVDVNIIGGGGGIENPLTEPLDLGGQNLFSESLILVEETGLVRRDYDDLLAQESSILPSNGIVLGKTNTGSTQFTQGAFVFIETVENIPSSQLFGNILLRAEPSDFIKITGPAGGPTEIPGVIKAQSSGEVQLVAGSKIRFFNDSSSYTFPNNRGTDGQILQIDAAGDLSWVELSGAAGPEGPAGPAGADGPPGADGAPGNIISVQADGVEVVAIPTAINFTGTGVTVTTTGTTADVEITGGSSGVTEDDAIFYSIIFGG